MRPDEQRVLAERLARDRENARVAAEKRRQERQQEDSRRAADRKSAQKQQEIERQNQQKERSRQNRQADRAETKRRDRQNEYWNEYWRQQQAQSSEGVGSTSHAPVERQTHYGSTVRAKSGGTFGKLLAFGILAILAYVFFSDNRSSPSGPLQNRPPEVEPRSAPSQEPAPPETIAKPTPITPEDLSASVPNAASGQEQADAAPAQAAPTQSEPPVQPSTPPSAQAEPAPAPAPITLRVARQVPPVYPEFAKQAHITGQVRVIVFVAPNGQVARTMVQSGNPILARAATDAIQRWRYEAFALAPGQLLPSTLVTFNFNP
jgi:periplasmic protein TonB